MAANGSRLVREGGCFPLPALTRLRVTGGDAERYLNGQLSNDVSAAASSRALPALLLTAKGKLCAAVQLWRDGEAFIVEADAVLRESLARRLERYAVADDVAFEDISDGVAGWHVFGPAAEGCSGLVVNRVGRTGCDIAGKPAGLAEAGPAEIEFLRIAGGVPRWGTELGEDTLPQEARLEESAVDFSKGCYVGQEVVSRLRSVGRVNRRLAGFAGRFPARPATLKNAADQAVGHLTSAASDPESGRTIALGYLQTREPGQHFSVFDESGACLGEAERREFPLVS